MTPIINIINSNLILSSFCAFLLGALTEFIWTRWIQHIGQKNRIKSSNYAVMTYMAAGLYTLFIVSGAIVPVLSHWTGCWIGNYIAVGK